MADGKNFNRGYGFPHHLAVLIAEHGPDDLSSAEQAALSDYLLESTLEWVRARNRGRTPSALPPPPQNAGGE